MTDTANISYSVGAKSLTVMADGDIHMLDDTDARFVKIKALLQQKPPKIDEALKLMDLKTAVVEASAGRVTIAPEGVTFEGEPLGGYMAERLVAMAGSGMDVKPWMLFMDNLMENPNADTREDIFKWMECGKMPITEDGCIVGFKKVRDNYTDVHTGKFSNAVGSVLVMPREQCDPSRNNTCSTGFHFCSADYLSKFSGTRVMVVKIDPRDVTAIPKDYNNAKARCCRYEVTGELSSQAAARHKVFSEPVMPEDPQEIPDLMAKNPKEVKSRRPGPESPVGTKKSSKRVASNAALAKDLPTPAAPKPKTAKKAAPKKTSKAKSSTKKTGTKVVAKVTKAATKAKKSVKRAGTKIVEALTEAVTTTPQKATRVKATRTARTKAKAPAKSNAPKVTKAAPTKSAKSKSKSSAAAKAVKSAAPANVTKAKGAGVKRAAPRKKK